MSDDIRNRRSERQAKEFSDFLGYNIDGKLNTIFRLLQEIRRRVD